MRLRNNRGLSIRAKALKKLSQFYVEDENTVDKNPTVPASSKTAQDNFGILFHSLPVYYSSDPSKLYTIPLTLSEWEILLSISETVPYSVETANKIMDSVIASYLLESPRQRISDVLYARFKLNCWRNPNEVLTFQLTKYIINICNKFPELLKKCSQLVDQYLSRVGEVFISKQSGLFSLLGFMNAFKDNCSATSLTLFTWKLISKQFFANGQIAKIDSILSSSTAFTNDAIVQYFDHGHELCGVLFVETFTDIQTSLIASLIGKPEGKVNKKTLSEYFLKQQYTVYQNDQRNMIETTDTELSNRTSESNTEFMNKINKNREGFMDICHSSINLWSVIENKLDFSSNDRTRYSFNILAGIVESLCLCPFIDEKYNENMHAFINILNCTIDKYLLTDIVTDYLVRSIICSGSLLNYFTEELSEKFLRTFPLLIGSERMTKPLANRISRDFTIGLQPLNEDAIVNTIYSINNLMTLSEDASPQMLRDRQQTLTSINSVLPNGRLSRGSNNGSVTSLSKTKHLKSETPKTIHSNLFTNCVTTTATIASEYKNQTITALTISILTQKVTVVSKDLRAIILISLAKLAPHTQLSEFSTIIKSLKMATSNATKNNDLDSINAVNKAKTILSEELLSNKYNTDIYKLHLNDILDTMIASGDVERLEHHRSHTEISRVAEQIAAQLVPLAALLPSPGDAPLDISNDEGLTAKFRNVWFNMAVHGYCQGSSIVKANYKWLLTIAYNSPPLASDFPANNKEMSLEMNTILRRGSSNSNLKQQKQIVSEFFGGNAVQQRSISSTKIMFVAATVLLETIRCETGVCSKILHYLSEPAMESSSIDKSISAIAKSIISKYIYLAQSNTSILFNSKTIAAQLNGMLLFLVYRNPRLQEAAFSCCHMFIRGIPSSLCHHDSLYTLLDLMTTTFDSILDCESNRFQPHFEFTLKHAGTKVLFPASREWRENTLKRLHQASKDWVKFILNKSNQDTKILLQSYISDISQFNRLNSVEFGVSFAMDMAGVILSADKELSTISYGGSRRPNTISGFISQHSWRSKYLVDTAIASSSDDFTKQLDIYAHDIRSRLSLKQHVSDKSITDFLDMAAALLILGNCNASSLVYDIVHLPFEVFSSSSLNIATNVWLTIIKERSDLAHILLADVCYCWLRSIDEKRGLYSKEHDLKAEENQMMEYSPFDKKAIDREAKLVSKCMQPHRHVLKFFASHFEGTLLQSVFLLRIFTKTILYSLEHLKSASLHPFAKMLRFEMLQLGISILEQNVNQKSRYVGKLSHVIVDGALSWFNQPGSWPFGSNELKIKADLCILQEFYSQLVKNGATMKAYNPQDFVLLQYFLSNEIQQIETWLSPLDKIKGANENKLNEAVLLSAFKKDPELASNLLARYKTSKLERYLTSLVAAEPLRCVGVADLVSTFITGHSGSNFDLHPILYWCPTNPLKSINLFSNSNAFVLQYSMFSLESHDVNVTFFYVPQIVQCLRYDKTGYVERLIIDTAKISVLFSHQIIWNMLANCYKDDEGTVPDAIKPTLDRVRERMLKSFSKSHLAFYEREFSFFNEVTGISGKLKPFIKKSKAEKKQKIDEEMARIKVLPDVYLPSNPDGVVVDINRTSGKPLQSHAKAPFMATFKIKKDIIDSDTGESTTIEKWQAAIFKVGDDCRQDVLALQLISLFRTIWSNIGLDVYVFPYRVTATAAGCGVIDVLPNSVSRDMLGREAVNGLYEYFISKFGPESSIEFQNARINFVKSLAGYSVISYLLQFKDRHNGNIMYDDQGHCLHIDFGFIFDIVPGGVKFEAVPFKLTKEMVKVMGGSNMTPSFLDFEELCIKAYLAARPHMDFIIECIQPMLDSGLPCFKGEKTIKNLRSRFQPDKTDHEAALYMKLLIKKSFESLFTVGYDEFQRLTNGIPY